jgi:hypothetical protein
LDKTGNRTLAQSRKRECSTARRFQRLKGGHLLTGLLLPGQQPVGRTNFTASSLIRKKLNI